MIAISFVIAIYVLALLFQVAAVFFSIKLYRRSVGYRIPCLLFAAGFLLMVARRIYPILDILNGKYIDYLDALTALVISGLLMFGTYFIAKAFSLIEAQSSIYEINSTLNFFNSIENGNS